MGNVIRVDHSEFKKTAQEMRNLIQEYDSTMKQVYEELHSIGLISFAGNDGKYYANSVDSFTGADSACEQMKKFLNSFADFLENAAEEYKDAQGDVVNKANSIK
jgi:uncharacterized protein YukE